MKFGLSAKCIQQILDVFAKYPEVQRVVLYGSRAKGSYKTGSDIDLTMKGDALQHSLLLHISDALDALLLPYTIELSIFTDISNPDLLAHIERVGIDFYRKD